MAGDFIDARVEVEHPLRRMEGGPSDVEWALLVDKVDRMENALKTLAIEIRSYNDMAIGRCGACANAKAVADHEKRLREVEKWIWKAMGIAAVSASLLSLLFEKIFK